VTDVVEKELFRIAPRTDDEAGVVGASPGTDRGHRSRLRPARDADVAAAGEADADRADVPLRPPAGGRYRQFEQFDVEAIGDPGPASTRS
jgi:hypothetical protein